MQFQSYAYGRNHWQCDDVLPVVLRHYWSDLDAAHARITSWGELVGTHAYRVGAHVDQESPPVLVMHDLDGVRIDRVRLSPAQEALMRELAPMMQPPYVGRSWHEHYAMGYLLADPGLYCLLTITQQVVYALFKYAPQHQDWCARLLRGDAWGATWMTENHGGSDLGANRTVARPEGEHWILSGGDKYFASGAGLTDVAIVTARPEGAPPGPKGIALFLVPRLKRDGSLNYHVRRLKHKSATRAVPSGEVDLEGSEAFLIGEADKGIYYTLENLTCSRLANAVAAMGIAQKARLEALLRVRRRATFGKMLCEHPLIQRDLVDLAVRQAGGTALAFHAVDAFDDCWRDTPPYSTRYHYARFLSHLAKNRTADHAAESTRLAMELFGGLGFLEEYAVARWHREALITPIWEGPSNIQALDLLEAIVKKHAHEPFLEEFVPLLEAAGTAEANRARNLIEGELKALAGRNADTAQWYGKQLLTRLADAAQVALLYHLAERQGEERFAQLATLYAKRFLEGEEYPSWAASHPSLYLPQLETES